MTVPTPYQDFQYRFKHWNISRNTFVQTRIYKFIQVFLCKKKTLRGFKLLKLFLKFFTINIGMLQTERVRSDKHT